MARGLLAALAAVAMLVLAACEDGDEPEPEEPVPETITFITPPDFSLGNQRIWAVRCWEQLDPDHPRIDFRELPPAADDQRAELMAKLQAGSNEYDVLALDVVWTQEFAKAGLIRPLDEVAADAYGDDAAAQAIDLDRFFPSVLETVRYDGQAYAAPLHTNVGLLYYRTEFDTETGPYLTEEDVPTTWSGLADFLTDPATQPPEGVAGYVGQLWEYEGLHVNASEVVWAHGGAFVDEDGQVAADADETVAGLEFLDQGLTEGWISRAALDYTESDSLDAFRSGDAAFLRHWPYAYAQLQAIDSPVRGKFGVTQLPGGTQGPGPNALGGANLAISKFSRHPEAAYEFIKFMISESVQRRMADRGGYPSALISANSDGEPVEDIEGIDEKCPPPEGAPAPAPAPETPTPASGTAGPGTAAPGTAGGKQPQLNGAGQAPLDEIRDEIRVALENARHRPATPYYDRVTTLIQGHVYDVLRGGADPESEMDALADQLRDALQGR